MKISIVGAGNVGGTAALRITQENLGHVVLIDIAPGLAQGKAYDLEDAAGFTGIPYSVEGSGDIHSLAGSDIVVVTAGAARSPGMTREDLLAGNAKVVAGVCDAIKTDAPHAVVIMVTNPVDVMTWYAATRLGSTKGRVFGMGPTLDAARFAGLAARELKVPVTKVDGSVIGSHGEGMVPLPRFTRIGKQNLDELVTDPAKLKALCEAAVERGQEIVSLMSESAFIAPSAAVCQLVRAVAKNEMAWLSASVYLSGQYEEKDVCAGLPCIIGRGGVQRIVELDLNMEERGAFKASVQSIRQLCSVLAA